MDKMRRQRWGVSPAFIVSLHGEAFTVNEFCQTLPIIHRLGFNSFQPEIYLHEAVHEWMQGGAKRVGRRASDLGLSASQFVVHFLKDEFGSPTHLNPSGDIETLKQCLDMCQCFPECQVITLPMPPFTLPQKNDHSLNDLNVRLYEKLHLYLEAVQAAGFKMALEILPFSLISGIHGFLDLCKALDTSDLGINLDTGHAWDCGEIMALLPEKLQGRVFGVHLKDKGNPGTQGSTPGAGAIAWPLFINNLYAWGYRGSLDLEILCPPETVEQAYRTGLRFLKTQLNRTQPSPSITATANPSAPKRLDKTSAK